MGLNDLYPFVIATASNSANVYRLIHRFPHSPDMVDEEALKAMVALLKKGRGGLTLLSVFPAIRENSREWELNFEFCDEDASAGAALSSF